MHELQRWILAEFRRRRRRELALVVPFVAGAWPLAQAVRAPGGRLFGLDGGLAAALGALVLGVALVLHWRNWRCPGCESYLGGGLGRALCPRCGARFES